MKTNLILLILTAMSSTYAPGKPGSAHDKPTVSGSVYCANPLPEDPFLLAQKTKVTHNPSARLQLLKKYFQDINYYLLLSCVGGPIYTLYGLCVFIYYQYCNRYSTQTSPKRLSYLEITAYLLSIAYIPFLIWVIWFFLDIISILIAKCNILDLSVKFIVPDRLRPKPTNYSAQESTLHSSPKATSY